MIWILKILSFGYGLGIGAFLGFAYLLYIIPYFAEGKISSAFQGLAVHLFSAFFMLANFVLMAKIANWLLNKTFEIRSVSFGEFFKIIWPPYVLAIVLASMFFVVMYIRENGIINS